MYNNRPKLTNIQKQKGIMQAATIDPDDIPTLADIPNLESSPLASIEIFEDLQQGATLRTSNRPSNQEQRPIVTVRGKKSLRYKSTVELATCVHGVLDDTAAVKVPATLIVLSYRLNGLTKGHPNYARVYTELELANMVPDTAPQDEPYVRAFAPFEVAGYDQETIREMLIKDTYKVTALNLKAMDVEVGVEGDVGREKEETRRKRYFRLLQGSVSSNKEGMKGYDTVWWNLRENENTEEGVPPVFSTAALVLRADMTSKIKMKFVMALQTGWWDDVTNKMIRFFGISRDDPVFLNPTLPPSGKPDWVVEGQLGRLLVDKGVKKLGGYKDMENLGAKKD